MTDLIVSIFFFTFSLMIGYLIGSIFISYPWGLLKGIDVTKNGTGQLGGSNAGRLLGWYVMPITGLFDVLKALISLVLVNYIAIGVLNLDVVVIQLILIANGVGLILGHIYSIYIKLYSKEWHGGKGAAPYGGILLFISWQGFLIAYAGLFIFLQVFKKVLKTKMTIYDNFLTNAIQLLVSPIVIYFFVPESWVIVWLLILIAILFIIEREKALQILGIKNK